MNPTYYLNFIPANIGAGDYARAARALCRSVSHAVTAAAVHWHHRHDTRRRLRLVVKAPVFDGHLRIYPTSGPAAFRFRWSGLCKVRDAALAVPGFPPSRERGITKPPETERCGQPGRY